MFRLNTERKKNPSSSLSMSMMTYILGDILRLILIQSINDNWIKKNILQTCKM